MGNKSKLRIVNIDPTLNAELHSQTGSCKIYRNRAAKQYEKYEIRNGHDQNFQKKYQYRIQNPSNYLVNAYYAKPVKNMFGCDSKEFYEVVIQRITKRFDEFYALSPQQALYVTYRVLKGYQILFKIFGIFRITQKMIGVDRDNKIKVWLNSNFSSNEKQMEELSSLSMPQSEQQITMTHNIMQLVSNKASKTLEWDNFVEEKHIYGRLGFEDAIKITKKHAILNQVVLQGSFGEKQDPFNWQNSHKSKLTLYHRFPTSQQSSWANEIIIDQSSVRETPIFTRKQYEKNQLQNNYFLQRLNNNSSSIKKSITRDQSPINQPNSNQHVYQHYPHQHYNYYIQKQHSSHQKHQKHQKNQKHQKQHQISYENSQYQHQYLDRNPLYPHQHFSSKQDPQYQYPYQQKSGFQKTKSGSTVLVNPLIGNRTRLICGSSHKDRIGNFNEKLTLIRMNMKNQNKNIKIKEDPHEQNIPKTSFQSHNRSQYEFPEEKIAISQIIKPLNSLRYQLLPQRQHMKQTQKYYNSRKDSQSNIPFSIPPESTHVKTQSNQEAIQKQLIQSDQQSNHQDLIEEIKEEDKPRVRQPKQQMFHTSLGMIDKNILEVNSQLTYLKESELMREELSRVINKDAYNIQETINQINTLHRISPDPGSYTDKSGATQKIIETSDNFSTKKLSLDKKINPNRSDKSFFAVTKGKEMVSYRDLRDILQRTRKRRHNESYDNL